MPETKNDYCLKDFEMWLQLRHEAAKTVEGDYGKKAIMKWKHTLMAIPLHLKTCRPNLIN